MSINKMGIPLEGFAEFSRQVAAQGAVLLKNENQVLPITSQDQVSIFGRCQIDYYRSGTGSGGSVNVTYTTNLLQGFRETENIHINEELATIYEEWIKENPFDNGGGGWAAEPWYQKEMPLSDEVVQRASTLSNKAIVVIGRTAGEDKDNQDIEGSYRLTKEEQKMLEKVTKYFSQVAVVLNVSNLIDMSWCEHPNYVHPIQSIIYVWHGGIEGGRAAADVLTGKVTPSGKLTDTIAYSLQNYPSTANYGGELKNYYQEDIYVGYRYFETFCPEKVMYEFGYGLSYTNFEISVKQAKVISKIIPMSPISSTNPVNSVQLVRQINSVRSVTTDESLKKSSLEENDKQCKNKKCEEIIQVDKGLEQEYKRVTQAQEDYIEVEVSVKNIGVQYSGKEVVQIYYEAPQGQLGKPKKELICFGKTRLLEPGESQSLILTFPVCEMAAYDDGGITGHKSAYVLEAGDYFIYVGNSVRNVVPVYLDGVQFSKEIHRIEEAYHIDTLQVTKQLEEALAPEESFTRMKPVKRQGKDLYELSYEPVPTSTIHLKERIENNLPPTLEITGDKGYKLKDVYEGKVSLEAFVQQLSEEELAILVRGEGMSSPLVTPGVASCFGGVSDKLFEYGLPIACSSDGPSGIRMDSGLQATQISIGALLAATWDVELVEALYEMEGKEMARNQIDVLLGPGMNIRRHPLNGRNFEYFSEDPYVNGKMASAVTKGLRKGGAHATLKHFACNNQEKNRLMVESVVSERALREIYLKGFEIAVKEGNAQCIMTTYMPLNKRWTASNYDLNTTILRHQWGYQGIVMTDWWAKINDVIEGGPGHMKYTGSMVRAQNDLYMVVNNYGAEINSNEDDTIEALESGKLQIGELQRSAMNICRFLMKTPAFFRKQERMDDIQEVKSKTELEMEHLYSINEISKVEVSMNQTMGLKVNQAGTYRLVVNIMSPDTPLAQTACQMILNNQVVTTIQIRGTEGRWTRQKLIKVVLEEGFYELRLEETKPNIAVKWIEFKKN